MKYEKFDILKKAKYSIVPNNRELYVVYVECDANDGDYMRDTIEFDKESFEEDELLLLVLSYVSKYSGRFSEKGWNSAGYGHHVDENKDFPWLSEYLSENDIRWNVISCAIAYLRYVQNIMTTMEERIRQSFLMQIIFLKTNRSLWII